MVTKSPTLKYERCRKCKTPTECNKCSYHRAVLRYARNGKDYIEGNVIWRTASPSERRALIMMTKGREMMERDEKRKGAK